MKYQSVEETPEIIAKIPRPQMFNNSNIMNTTQDENDISTTEKILLDEFKKFL